ncbi:MAG TPA: AraC family transcriptional regulator [Planctomycetota bacterium]|nr:AraC family transcriptional regulator [Planctomycetota bacterium]
MKSERCYDIPEKREALVPVAADCTRFAVWRVARERWGPAFRFRSPRVDTLFCGLVLSGQLEQADGADRVRLVGPGEVVLCGAGGPRSHAVHDPKGVEIVLWVALRGVATDMARSWFPDLPTSFPVTRAGAMESLFQRMLEEAERGGPEAGRICGCLGEALLLRAAHDSHEQSGPRSRREEQFLRIRRYVLDRLAQPLTVSRVAREVGISRVYLHRLFREFEGESPQTWIQRHRMSLAAELLQSGGQTVQEVAYTLGWADPYAFSRSFKRVTGVPPSQMIRRKSERRLKRAVGDGRRSRRHPEPLDSAGQEALQ